MAMRFLLAPPALLHLIATILLTPSPIAAKPAPAASVHAGFSWNELFARYDCSGELCGWNKQLCCPAGHACYTNAADEAQCSATASVSAAASASARPAGHWEYYTVTVVMTDLETVTRVSSTYVAGASGSAGSGCHYALNETPCGNICCASNQYCAYEGQCAAAYGGQTTTTATEVYPATAGPSQSAGPPLRGTSISNVLITQTKTPTTTIPFETPVETGANITMTAIHEHNNGLSGGAIAGIVIGVLIALFILGLICFYCCIKGLLDGCLALFGLGNSRRVTEVDEYERRTHHSSGGGRRTWYGAPARPSRVEKRDSHLGRDVIGIGAGLAALWAVLGFKRRRQERREQEKYSEYDYSSDYYTSASSASTDDRGTRYSNRYVERDTRRTDVRRSGSRR